MQRCADFIESCSIFYLYSSLGLQVYNQIAQIPEGTARRDALRLTKKKAKVAAAARASSGVVAAAAAGSTSDSQGMFWRALSAFAVFMPKTVTGPNGSSYRDWNMTYLALVLFGHLLSLVSVSSTSLCAVLTVFQGLFQIKYLYAGHVYGWGAEQVRLERPSLPRHAHRHFS